MTILELLEAHKLGWVADDAGHYKCSCGFYPDPFDGADATSDDHHRAHVAEVIENHTREQQARAWSDGFHKGRKTGVGVHISTWPKNPYRAAQYREGQ